MKLPVNSKMTHHPLIRSLNTFFVEETNILNTISIAKTMQNNVQPVHWLNLLPFINFKFQNHVYFVVVGHSKNVFVIRRKLLVSFHPGFEYIIYCRNS